jgi:RecA-family ATPase
VPRANRPAIQQAEYIAPQEIEWIWQPYIPRGMLVMLDGDPGIGKSMTLVQIAANLSRSWAFLDQLGKPTLMPDIDGPASTLMLSAEDSLEHVMVPRLTHAGADLTKIRFMTGWLDAKDTHHSFDLQHMPMLVEAIQAANPVLVVLDPLVAYLGAIDMHRSNQTRPLMEKLKQVAETSHCTILGIRHPSKLDLGGPLMYRGQGWPARANQAATVRSSRAKAATMACIGQP